MLYFWREARAQHKIVVFVPRSLLVAVYIHCVYLSQQQHDEAGHRLSSLFHQIWFHLSRNCWCSNSEGAVAQRWPDTSDWIGWWDRAKQFIIIFKLLLSALCHTDAFSYWNLLSSSLSVACQSDCLQLSLQSAFDMFYTQRLHIQPTDSML